MSVDIVTVANRVPDLAREPYYKYQTYIDSLARFGVTPTILGMGEPWGGLMTKPRRLRQWLRAGNCKSDILICCDAFDIVFVAPPDEVEKKYRELWPGLPILFNAERAVFPRGELAHLFPDFGTPWRYLNSGFFIGPPATILAMLEAMWLDDIANDHQGTSDLDGGAGTWVNPNDQGHMQAACCMQVVPIELDWGCHLCQTLSDCSIAEFDLEGPRIKNIATGTEPLVWHGNGDGKSVLLPAFMRKWGLE